MREFYVNPKVEIVNFDTEDVIATSTNIDVDDGDDIIDLPFVPAD